MYMFQQKIHEKNVFGKPYFDRKKNYKFKWDFKKNWTPLYFSQYFDCSAWEIILLDKNIGLPPNNVVADAKINKIVVTYLL